MKNNCIHRLNSNQSIANTFILLSAGINKSRGEKRCKSLIRDGKDFAIDKQIRIIRRFDKSSEVIIVAGYDFNNLCDYVRKKYPEIRIIENQNFQLTTSLESLRLGINASISSNIYAIHGDRLFNTECIAHPRDAFYVTKQIKRASQTSVGLNDLNGHLLNMSYGLNSEWCQNFFIPYNMFSYFRDKIKNVNKNINLFEVINQINEEHKILVHSNSKITSNEIKQV